MDIDTDFEVVDHVDSAAVSLLQPMRCLVGWAWLETRRTRRVIGFDSRSGGVVVTAPLTAIDMAAPPTWVTMSSGERVVLLEPSLRRADEIDDVLIDAIDVLRGDPAVANDEIRLTRWRPASQRQALRSGSAG